MNSQPRYAEYLQDNLQPRPKELTHMMVVQAYKKAQAPQHQDHFRKQKKRGESSGPLEKGRRQNPINAMGSFKKNDLQGIMETTNKLIII